MCAYCSERNCNITEHYKLYILDGAQSYTSNIIEYITLRCSMCSASLSLVNRQKLGKYCLLSIPLQTHVEVK